MGGGLLVQRRSGEADVLRQAVRDGWPGVLAAAEERGGLPRRVHEEVRRALGCGDVRRGFTLARCDACEESTVIAFSCKTRGWCPSCAARRGHEAAAHLDEVLPRVGWRQWTVTVPRALRWAVVRQARHLRAVERTLARAVFRWQRRRAKELGVEGKVQVAAVGFTQLFNAHLGLHPHSHLLVAEGVWQEGTFTPLQREGAQLSLRLDEEAPPRRGALVAEAGGSSLHAGTFVHGNDREGLLRLVRYGARGPIAGSRLSRREDGRYEYATKKGVTLVLTAEQLVRRLVWLIPPKGLHLTNFHGALASHASARASLLPAVAREEARRCGQDALTRHSAQAPSQLPLASERAKGPMRRPRLDWATLHARTWAVDVWQCPCGGRRRVTAVVTNRRTAEEVLRNLGLLPRGPAPPHPPARLEAPPQLALAL